MKIKGTLPLVWKHLSDSDRKTYSFLELDELIESEDANNMKVDKIDNKDHKVGVKNTVPLVAKFLNTDEQTINKIYDIE